MDSDRALTYAPAPIRTEGVVIDDGLTPLVEDLARNAHDLWALQRLQDGWSWGEERCDQTKRHPCLVAYDDLPESEKAYDLTLVQGTLKAILALGYTVLKDT